MRQGYRLKSTDIETIANEFNDNIGLVDSRLDRIEKGISDIRRMLRWLVAEQIHTDKDVVDEMRLKAACNQPDISDILEEGDERD